MNTNCPYKQNQIQQEFCKICRKKGHSNFYCQTLIYHNKYYTKFMKLATCVNCGKRGHINCNKLQESKENSDFVYEDVRQAPEERPQSEPLLQA